MQGQRSSVESLPEAFEFDHAPNSNSSSMDQDMLWNTMLLNPAETQSMPEFLLTPSDANMSYVNVANDNGSRLSIWSSGGAGSSQHTQNQGSLVENKLDHGWRAPLTINSVGGSRINDRHFEPSNISSMGLNLNSVLIDDGQSFSQSSSFSDMRENLEFAADRFGTTNEVSESSQSGPYSSGHISSSIASAGPCGSSLAEVGPMPEDDGRAGSSLDGRRLACKRKNIEGFPGQSSTSGNTSSSHRENSLQHSASHNYNPLTGFSISGPSVLQPAANSAEESSQSFGTSARGMASECYPSASTVGNAESSSRNYRMRVNPAHSHEMHPASIWSEASIRRSHQWQLNQPSHPFPLNLSPEPMQGLVTANAQNQHHIPIAAFPQTAYHLPWSGASNSRIGSSSSSFNIDDRMIDTRAESNLRNMPMANSLDFVPATETHPMSQEPVNWNLGSRGINIASSSRVGSSTAPYPPGSPWVPHQSPATQYPRRLSEAVHHSLFASGNSESGGQGTSFPVQRAPHPISSQDLAQLRASLRGLQPAPHVRSAYNVERQSDGPLGAPLSMRSSATREGRNRMISEIRLALESMRSASGLRFEDMFMLDQTVILAGADLHDRHRDMRLDVDNMSYEELLALEERIGNVSTGLNEETIMKCLKQHKYIRDAEELMEQEPCCVCQEEYAGGENVGTLACGHDFHTHCIKQWLMQKNICPICKNTALVT